MVQPGSDASETDTTSPNFLKTIIMLYFDD